MVKTDSVARCSEVHGVHERICTNLAQALRLVYISRRPRCSRSRSRAPDRRRSERESPWVARGAPPLALVHSNRAALWTLVSESLRETELNKLTSFHASNGVFGVGPLDHRSSLVQYSMSYETIMCSRGTRASLYLGTDSESQRN